MLLIGKITKTHGIKGEVKVQNLSDFDRFFVGAKIKITDGKALKEIVIEQIRSQNKILLIKFEGYNDLNQSELLRGKELFIEESDYEVLDDDNYHYNDLIGLDCIVNEIVVGKVTGIIEVPQGHILEITIKDKKKLVPFVSKFVTKITNKEIVVEPIEGLL